MERTGFRATLIGLVCVAALSLATFMGVNGLGWFQPSASVPKARIALATLVPTMTSTSVPLSYPWSTPAPLPTTVLCWKIGNNHSGTLEACVINDRTQSLSIHPLSEQRAREILDIAGFHCLDEASPSWLCEEALNVARCESHLYVVASGNRRQAYGLFQLTQEQMEWVNQTFGLSFNNLFDPVQNAQIAYLVWNVEGWKAWPACQP